MSTVSVREHYANRTVTYRGMEMPPTLTWEEREDHEGEL
jgi:hypothetical protein